MGHLRSTMIGNSLKHIAEKCGYEVVGINYIGDWGTQFGKLITAYKNGEMKQLLKKIQYVSYLSYMSNSMKR